MSIEIEMCASQKEMYVHHVSGQSPIFHDSACNALHDTNAIQIHPPK